MQDKTLTPDSGSGEARNPAAAHEGILALDIISQLLTTSAFDLDKLLSEIVRTTAETMRMKASTVRLLHKETGQLILRAMHGLSQRFLSAGAVFDTESRFQQLIERGGILEISDVRRETDLFLSGAARAEGICSWLAVGLYRDDEVIGALSIFTDAPHAFTESEIRTLRVIANQAAIAVQLAQLHQTQMEQMWLERELALAGRIQSESLPQHMPVLEGVRIAGASTPWKQIGGDFYDFIELPEDNLGIAIGDVSGKGVPAALLMFTVRMALRSHVEHEYGVREIMRRVNRAVYRDTLTEQFATLFYGVLHAPSRVFTYVNAAQNPPLLFRKDQVLLLEAGGLPVGVLPEATYQEEAVQLLPGDLLVLFTDGFTEVSGANDELIDEKLLIRWIRSHRHLEPEQIIQELEQHLARFVERSDFGDDRTLVVLKVDPTDAAGPAGTIG